MTRRILVVDDDPATRGLLQEWLRDGARIVTAADAEEGVRLLLSEIPDAALVDVVMPGGGGRHFLAEARRYLPGCAVVAMSGEAQASGFVEMFRGGVSDFLAKPLTKEAVLRALARAARVRGLRDELSRLGAAPPAGDAFSEMIGESPAWKDALKQLRAVAGASADALIVGPLGSGASLAARCLHWASDRRDGPFVRVSCAALPPSLLEAELFGHAAGAFTGAAKARGGRFEEARGGTLVLSRVESVPLEAQARLLRALESHAVQRIGENEERVLDVRIVATMSRDPGQEALAGRLRPDMAHRLERLRVDLPPLAERGDDLLLLAARLLERLAAREQRRPKVLSPAAVAMLRAHEWPGNVRELGNVLERAVIQAGDEEMLAPSHLSLGRLGLPAVEPADWPLPEGGLNLPERLAELERELIAQAMERAGGHHAKAAALLRIGRSSLERRLAP